MSGHNGVAVKIKTYRVGKRGLRGLTLSLPKVWANDCALEPGDILDVLRTDDNRLIIQLADKIQAAAVSE